MNKSELAKALLEWESAQKRADELRETIEDAVMLLQETVKVGNVKAAYSKGRKSYDYKGAADDHPKVGSATVELFITQGKPGIDWRGICKHVGADDIAFTQGEPSVSLQILAQ